MGILWESPLLQIARLLYTVFPMMIRASDAPEEAFNEAYNAYADAIFRHCAFRLINRERGREIMQDTFMKTWEYIAKGKNIDNVQAFLYRTANNLIIDEVRRRNIRPETSLDALMEEGFEPGTDDDARAMRDTVDIKRILAVLNKMEEPYRGALVMRYVNDLSPADIAGITGESPNVISVRLHRATEKLKSLIKR